MPPVYDYCCAKCNKNFEMYHSKPDDSPEECPDCGNLSQKIMNTKQTLRNINYTPPPLAKRKFGEAHRSHHKRDKWV